MFDIEPHYKDLSSDDYVLTPRDVTIFDSCTDTKGPDQALNPHIWFLEGTDLNVDSEAYMALRHVISYHGICDRKGIIYIGEFLRYTCPAGEYYQGLSSFAKELTKDLHTKPSNDIVKTAFKYSGCSHKDVVNNTTKQEVAMQQNEQTFHIKDLPHRSIFQDVLWLLLLIAGQVFVVVSACYCRECLKRNNQKKEIG